MNNKLFLTILLNTVFIINIFCQRNVHLISLRPLNKIDEKEFYINKVIDNRQNKEYIGIVQKGLMNRQVPAKFVDDFEQHILDALEILVPRTELKEPVQVRINKLMISELSGATSESGECEIELELLKEKKGKFFTLGKFNSVIKEDNFDVTAKHNERIIKALIGCINQFSGSKLQKPDSELDTASEEKLNDKFKMDTILKKGLYSSYNDMYNNNPFDSINYEIKLLDRNRNRKWYQVYYSGTKKRVKNIYGFCDGQSIYLSALRYTLMDYFVKSKMIGRYVYFEDRFPYPPSVAAFGLASSKNRAIVLDFKTGLVTVLSEENIEIILEDHPDLLSEYKTGNKSIESVKLIIQKLNQIESN